MKNVRIQRWLWGIVAFAFVTAQPAYGQGGGRGMGSPPPPPFGMHDLSGYWELVPDGRSVPQAELVPGITKATLEKVANEDLISERWCRPIGLPAMMDTGRPLELQQGRWEIVIVAEANTAPRHIYTSRPEHINADIFDPSSIGDSIGHWEGDTLVVDTVGFHPKNGRMMIPGGSFRTESSRLVEHYKLIKNGSYLSVTFTWTDPKVYRTPHTYEFWYMRVPGKYEPHQAAACDPWDEDRTAFVERPWTPALRQQAESELVKPGTPVTSKNEKGK